MIYIFPRTATPTELLGNGYGRLDAIKCTVYEEINADFYCELTVPIGGANAAYFLGGAIVRVPTHRGLQYFRLAMPEQDLTTIKSKAWHISYDLHSDMILNTSITAKTGAQAISLLLAAGVTETRFSGTSDITTVTNMKAVRCSILSAIMDSKQENTFVRRWGGEVERNNFILNVKSSLGSDNGVKISWMRNLTGFEMKEDWTTIVTRVVPTCLKENDTSLSLPEVYVDSSRISDYPRPVMRAIHFSDIKVGKEIDGTVPYPTEASAFTEMRNRCAAYYASGVDLPNVSADISLADISKTVEYASYTGLETVNLGDTVTGTYRDTTVTRRVRAITYDGLDERIDKVKLGDASKNIVTSKLYAQDIDISALTGQFANTIKQGEKYYEASITHDDGFRVDGSTSLNGGYAKFNADQMGFFDASGNMVGGMAYIYSRLAMIASMLTDDPTNPEYWAEIGAFAGGGGISLFQHAYSDVNPLIRLVVGIRYLNIIDNNNNTRLALESNLNAIRDANNIIRFGASATVTQVKDAADKARFYADGTTTVLKDENGTVRFYADAAITNLYDSSGNTRFKSDSGVTSMLQANGDELYISAGHVYAKLGGTVHLIV